MDAETEVSRMEGVTEGDTDDGLDSLLRKAVTVSQVNLPIATINKDIDDIANAYAQENERPDNALDEDFMRLLERTRQRRELLDQKMGKTSEAVPRKRRSPLCEDLASNSGRGSTQSEGPPKRQCLRENETAIKPDTPAITSVKSRLQALSAQRAQWSEGDGEDKVESSPVPTPRKSMSSPPLERAKTTDLQENAQPSSQRKNRFAQLASNISSWEDDLSHPIIVNEEEKKPRWQPPEATTTSASAESKSAKLLHSEKSPQKSVSPESRDKTSRSPVKPGTKASCTSQVKASQQECTSHLSPVKSSASSKPDAAKESKSCDNQKPGAQQEKVPDLSKDVQESKPLNASSSSEEQKGTETQKGIESISNKGEETKREPKETKLDVQMRGSETPRTGIPPTDRPLSARLANWEQKISENIKSDIPSTPKSVLTTPGKMTNMPRKDCTPGHPLSTPASEESESVQIRPKARKNAEDEPTEHSVSARMSAWEQMSSAQVVSSIKKVKPDDSSPVKTPGPKTPATQKSPLKSSTATPAKSSIQDGIKERIAQMNPVSTSHQASNTPSKSQGAGSAAKSVQWQLAQQSQSTDTAQRLRQERMAELQRIQNRWKNGILKDDNDIQLEEPPKAESPAKSDKRRGMREKARADVDEAMETEPSEVEAMETEPSEVGTVEDTKLESSEDQDSQKVEMVSINKNENVAVDSQEAAIFVAVSELRFKDSTSTKANEYMQTADKDKLEQKCENEHGIEPNERIEMVDQQCKAVLNEGSTVPMPEMKQESEMEINKHNPAQASEQHQEEAVVLEQEVSAVMGRVENSILPVLTSCQPNRKDDQMDSVSDQTCCADENEKHSPSESNTSNFESKLATIGLDVAKEDKTKENGKAAPKSGSTPVSVMSGSQPTSGSRPTRPTSLFNIVSQQKTASAVSSPMPVSTAGTSKACHKVKFDDSFDNEDSEASLPKKQTVQQENDTNGTAEDVVTEDADDVEVVLRRPRPGGRRQHPKPSEDDDDLSLSAFVPESVRHESILPSERQELDSSIDSFEGAPGAPPDFHKSTVDLVKLGQQYADSDSCSSLNTADSTSQLAQDQPQSASHSHDMEESVDDRDAIGDLLDEAMDSDLEEPSTSAKPPVPVMRKKANQRKATLAGDLPFSINEYRASRNMQIQEVKQVIVRNSQYTGMAVKEEDVEMPSSAPIPAPRHSVQDRIKELQELVQQEQSVIMQTSNALNQCCSSTSHFVGSSEQVECNRILLISCQKRQAYMTEIQRLKDTRMVDPAGPGPKGSLTISDIRLPLKKEFVTKIGTSHDDITYYFILLLKNGPQMICTQMLSTHDPMMRGSLDFPNLIKINDITGSFRLQLEIYSMSVSCEASAKDKKKKTPKKTKGSALTVQSPGGPLAVRTTSFSQVTTVELTMKSLDKHCFSLDRLSYLSPLHGMIYMNLKCVMEASVEERGFLTMFEDVSGLGSWHRRWCAVSGNKLQYWKYPDDETRKEPMGYIDLKRCVTEKVGLISRDICARPHTFELTTVRQPLKGERDTLVSRTYNTMTTIRHMLSADTKEERIVWCNKINRALANIRTWHSDAMRPIPK